MNIEMIRYLNTFCAGKFLAAKIHRDAQTLAFKTRTQLEAGVVQLGDARDDQSPQTAPLGLLAGQSMEALQRLCALFCTTPFHLQKKRHVPAWRLLAQTMVQMAKVIGYRFWSREMALSAVKGASFVE